VEQNLMSNTLEVRVPNIGDFDAVEVIEVLVKVGDSVSVDQSLITVESDKASMEIPSSSAGTIAEIKVKIGDKVAEGSVVVLLAAQSLGVSTAADVKSPAVPAAQLAAPTPSAIITGSSVVADHECDLVVLGAGPGGYSAAFRAADLGLNVILVERYPTLGGVCLNVGCIPSKALLHVAAVADEARALADHGIGFGPMQVDLDRLRGWKDQVVGKLTGGLAAMARTRKVKVIQGRGEFIDAHHLAVEADAVHETGQGSKTIVRFRQAIIAAGSQAVSLPSMPKDPRVIDSTGALKLTSIPKRMLIVGGGIIGLEMGTVYSSIGTRLDVVEMLDRLMPGADRDLVKVWEKKNAHRFDRIMLNTKTVSARSESDGIHVRFESVADQGSDVSVEEQIYDLVLVSVGRRPNGDRIGAQHAGVAVDARGFIAVDRQMKTNVGHIFAIGDLVGQPMLAHKAVHEGHVAAEVAAGQKRFFDARVIPSVAYTDPEIAWVGITEEQAKKEGLAVRKGVFPWAASGRAIANGRDEGFTKLLFDENTHRIIGGGIVGTHAGDLIGEVALAIEMGADAVDIGRTIHPHPTLGESIGMAAEVFEGACTDLPPSRKSA
jgi:dihydrolipoamide dehydrogenase